MASTIDSADEAGGESVFTSDGLPSLVAPLPPPPLPSINGGIADGNSNQGAVIDGEVITEESNPNNAFEAFADAAATDNGWGGGGVVTITSSSLAWQDPRRRLIQLKAELDSLEATLANEHAQATTNTNDNGDEDEDNNNQHLKAMTMELKSRLSAMGMSDGDNNINLATMLRGRQEDLSRVIVKDLQKFGTSSTGSTGSGSATGNNHLEEDMDNLSLTKNEKGDGTSNKIVYELYRTANNTASKTIIPREVQLEERLRKLELALGATTTATAEDNLSIMERLQQAERLTNETNPKQLDKLAAKAKVIRADLEAAARARTKLASKSSSTTAAAASSSTVVVEDANTIAALHTQLIELEGYSANLPALTVRLLELSNLHSSAAEFGARLAAAEMAVARSEGVLLSVEEALEKMEGGWKSNMESVENNLKRLDELLIIAKSG